MIYKESFCDPISVEYSTIDNAKYVKETIKKNNGKTVTNESIVIQLKNCTTKIKLKTLDSNCNYNKLADLINEISKSDEEYSESSQIVTLNEMSEKVKMSYMKIIINMTYSDDGEVDAQEYSEMLSLITRLGFSPAQRVELRAYMTIDKENIEEKLEDNKTLIDEIANNCPDGNEKSLHISLVKDLINVHKSVSDGEIDNFSFLIEIKPLLDVSDAEIKLTITAIENDRKIIEEELSEDAIKKIMKDLAIQASSVGVPIAAVYMTGSVMGLSAAGMTSGLAMLGFGGILGFSSMATGIGVAIALGVGTYKGIKFLTGASEIEKGKKREFLLQEVIKHTQKTINMLIEDISYVSVRLQDLLKSGEVHKIQILKLTKALSLLSKVGTTLNHKIDNYTEKALKTKCPKELIKNRLESLTKEPTKKKFFDIVLNCYDPKEVSDDNGVKKTIFCLKGNITTSKLSSLIKIFDAIGYFDEVSIAKNKAQDIGNQAMNKIGGFFK